ncbi:DUF6875 domain-containing protein [Saccharothrix variisporea]|uniref:DUF6875 domain-containing protein n=1 Tax=Saccharothrix variisporea TaxID=543527 RepID=A0A495XQ98_9PSEU|nr:hypothetical protein [Saccharothrix variisporea]RKT74623.1 hypothetical protein DFJ66_7990 [Saccharothrix variisporea]
MRAPSPADEVLIRTADEVDAGDVAPELTEVLAWARTYLVSPSPDLGRRGPVCPYTQPSLQRGLFFLASPTSPDVPGAVAGLRRWYEAVAATMPAPDRELLTVLLVLPHVDPVDPTPLDELQRAAKDDFVANGLMIGQFHPACEAPGLWNPDYRPLRSPVPLLAIRELVVFDLPFLVEERKHLDSYLSRFAPTIPTRVRRQLTARLAPR